VTAHLHAFLTSTMATAPGSREVYTGMRKYVVDGPVPAPATNLKGIRGRDRDRKRKAAAGRGGEACGCGVCGVAVTGGAAGEWERRPQGASEDLCRKAVLKLGARRSGTHERDISPGR